MGSQVCWYSECPNLETFLAILGWRAYFRVSGRRSNRRVPFVLFQPSRTAGTLHRSGTTCCLVPLRRRSLRKPTQSSARAQQYQYLVRHVAIRTWTLELLYLGNFVCLCQGLSVPLVFWASVAHITNNCDHGPFSSMEESGFTRGRIDCRETG